MRTRHTRLRALAALFAMSLLAAACGEDAETGGDTGSATTADGGATGGDAGGDGESEDGEQPAGGDIVAEAAANTEANKEGTFRQPPTEGPAPQEGAQIMVISCGELLPSCSEPSGAVREVAESLGWQVDFRDSNFDPSAAGPFIEEAVAAGYDGIIMDAIDCAPVRPALQEAKDAGIPVVSFYAFDCDDPLANAGEGLFDTPNYTTEYDGYNDYTEAWGAAKADWLIAETEGQAKIIELRQDDFLVVSYINNGFEERIAECETCEIVETVNFTGPDIASGAFAQKVATALQANPDATAIHFPYDGLFLLGGAQALQDSGRAGEIIAVGGETTSVNFDLIRQGVQDVANVFVHEWTARASIDALNRLMQGETEIPDSGLGWVIVDEENVPAEGQYEPEIDFRAAFEELWGQA